MNLNCTLIKANRIIYNMNGEKNSMVKKIQCMKTLIEVKTGKVVDTGDLITVNGKQVKLADLDVPSLIAKGILDFW